MTKHQAIPVLPVQDRIRGCLIGGAAGLSLIHISEPTRP